MRISVIGPGKVGTGLARDAGPMINVRRLETHAMLWIDLAMKRGFGRGVAFALEHAKSLKNPHSSENR